MFAKNLFAYNIYIYIRRDLPQAVGIKYKLPRLGVRVRVRLHNALIHIANIYRLNQAQKRGSIGMFRPILFEFHCHFTPLL